MTKKRVFLGKQGEELARAHLQKQGYRILEQNFRTRLGEIDLVAEDNGTLVFVEVKARSGRTYGSPFDAITYAKRVQISKVALEYLGRNNKHENPARFDVVSVSLADTTHPEIEIIKGAFELSYGS